MADNELQFILRMKDEATAILRQHGAAINEAAGQARELSEAHKEAGASLGELIHKAQEATEAFVSMWAANEMARGAIEAFEQAEAGLRQIEFQSEATSDAIKNLREDLTALSMKDGNATANQLTKIAGEAAKIGASVPQMQAFAKAMSELGNAQNIGQLTAEVTRTVEATGEGIGVAVKYSQAIAALAKGSREGAAGIAEMTSMLASRTTGMDVGAVKLAAYAKTLESLGGIPRASVGMVSNALLELQAEGEKGGLAMQALGERVGMTQSQMQALARAHPEEAFHKLLEVVSAIKAAGNDPKDFLESVGIHGTREQQVITELGTRIEKLNENMKTAAGAGQEALDRISKMNSSGF